MRNQSRILFVIVCALAAVACSGQGIITTMAGFRFQSCGPLGDGGPATSAQLCNPHGPTVDTAGNVYFYDYGNARIRKVAPDGTISTVAGSGTFGAAGDGGPALSASLGSIQQLAWSNAALSWFGPAAPVKGQLCFGDNIAYKVRCVSLDTGLIQGFGTGVTAYGGKGDGGPFSAATFNSPEGVAFDAAGNFYISDFSDSRVRKVDAVTGIITTFAGPGPGYCCSPVGDGGPATLGNLYEPMGLAYFGGGLYIADQGNARVRRVDLTSNIITTVAGNGTYTYAQEGTPATSGGVSTSWITLDGAGDLFLGAVQMVDTMGIIHTVAGQPGISGSGSDDIPATQTVFGGLGGLAWDPVAQRLLLIDQSRVRQVFYTPATATTLSSSQNPTVPSGTVTIQASVAPADATGSVRFYTGYNGSGYATSLGSMPVVNGIATLSWTAPASVTTTLITGVYGGDPTHNLSQSPSLSEAVQRGTTTTALASSANPAAPGQSVTFTATVTPAAVVGFITFNNGANSLGTATLQNGVATLTTATLPLGSNSIQAVYNGNTNYSGSTSPVVTQVVGTVAAVTATPNPAIVGAAVTLAAAIAPATATGSVQFMDGATVLGTATLAGGTASIVTSTLGQGPHSITVVYSGDANNGVATSPVLTLTVNPKPATTATVTATPNPSLIGGAVTFSATVTPASASGTVQFLDGSTVLSTVTLANGTGSFSSSTLTVGPHSITVVYSGDANNAGSTSAVLTQTVNPLPATTTTVAATPNPSIIGAAVTLSAAVTPAAATGTVQFLDGAAVLSTVTLANGTASFGSSTLALGPHSITAVYSGDSTNAGSTSAALTQTVNPLPATTTTVTATPNPSITGAAVTLSATVTPATAAGTVQFLDGATVLSTVTLANGTASFNSSTLALGTHSITAVYSGDSSNAASTSAALTQTVNPKPATTTALTATPNPSVVNAQVTLVATVSPATATGSVQFLDGASVLNTGTLAGGTVSFSLSTLTTGTHSITAVYSGDAGNAGSTSSAVTQTVKATSTTSIGSNLNPSTLGGPVTFTAIVAPADATGTVLFTVYNSGNLMSSVSVPVAGGVATWNATNLSSGSNTVTAAYSGDGTYAASTSSGLTQMVRFTSFTGLTSNPNPSVLGGAVVLTATVYPPNNGQTGTIQFFNGATLLGAAPVNTSSVAQLTTTALPVGTNSLTATYGGDTYFAPSTATPIQQTVNKATTTTNVVSGPNPSIVGTSVTLVATVTPASATGTVQFLDGATVLGASTLAGGAASFSISTLAQGSHSITAVYGGDGANAGSASAAVTQTVNPKAATTTALASSLNPSVQGQAVTFTATVTPSAATGIVTFSGLGSVAVSNGVASISTSALSVGTTTITAQYSGNSSYNPSTSAGLAQVVKAVSTTSLTSTPNPSTVGQNVTFTATITPSSATGSVQFLNGATVIGTASVASGRATLTTSALTSGGHSITASYSGDTADTASTSTALTQTVNVTAPSAPSSLTATAAGASEIDLAWTASATSGVTYSVYRSTSSGFTPSAANRVASGVAATAYASTGLTASTTYYFRVTAVNSAGESGPSNQASAATSGTTSCHVVYSISTQWNNGFTGGVTIQNTGTTTMNSWTLTWTWPGNQQMTQSWNANYTETGANVKLTNLSYNATIAPGATLSGVGFNGSYNGKNNPPTAFSVNGTLCH